MKWESPCGRVVLYCGDCLDVLPTIGKVDALVTDPPYGIKAAKRGTIGTSKCAAVKKYAAADWDDSTVNDEVKLAMSLSQYHIIFGGNYYELPPTSCWLVWDKLNSGDFADCELAWTNLKKAVRRICHRWNGMIREGNEARFHPTQKPLAVMEWCIGHLPKNTETILDPFFGSGTTGVAAVKLGKRFIGIEEEPAYFEIAKRRIMDALGMEVSVNGVTQRRLFTEEAK